MEFERAALEAHIRSKRYYSDKGSFEVLRDFRLEVPAGQFLCLLGPSGCGKSTFLRIVTGLDMDFEGEVAYQGENIQGPGRERSLVFQQARLLPWKSVLANVEFALDGLVPAAKRTGMAMDALRLVELAESRDSLPFQLSGGMMKRVALARAVADPPEVLLLDEPFGALDFHTRELIHNNIVRIRDEHKFTILMVTHDLDEAIYLSDRIVILGGSPAHIKEDISIDLARPRDRLSGKFQAYFRRVLKALELPVHASPTSS